MNSQNNHGLVFFIRVILPAILAFGLFAGLIFLYLIPGFERGIMDRKREMTRELTHSVWSVCDYYNQKVIRGELSLEQAQVQSISTIKSIRYGEESKDYFWITDLRPYMIMHPYRSQLDGSDLSMMKDPHGKAMFVEFVKAAQNTEGGYVDYMWQWKDDTSRIVPKLSYVKLFKPWGWVIGTGIYIEDVRSEIRRIENRSVLISGFICMFIIILLTIITRQSHRFEKGRREAEQKVRESRERYRALAEAATEGVLIWSDQGLHANKTMLAWLDYTEDEINQKHLAEILIFSAVSEELFPEKLYDELSVRQFTECELKGKGGSLIRVHADLSAILLKDQKAVMLVARPMSTSESNKPGDNILYEALQTGFFRTSFSHRNRILYASRATRNMLGFLREDEIFQYSIDSFFADQLERKSFLRELAETKHIIARRILLKNKSGEKLYGIVSVVVKENSSGESWVEGCIEPFSGTLNGSIIPPEKLAYSFLLIMDTPVIKFGTPALECPMYETVSKMLPLLKESGKSHILVLSPEGIPMGILTLNEIAHRLAAGESADTQVFRWMSSPPDLIPSNSTLAQALPLLADSKTQSLIIINNTSGTAEGLLTFQDMIRSFGLYPDLLINKIQGSVSVKNLKEVFQASRVLSSAMLLKNTDSLIIVRLLSAIADTIFKRVVELCIDDCGKPPVSYAIIQLGSAGRKEQGFVTDQDNAIVFNNVPKQELPAVNQYFLQLGMKINTILDEIGYSKCKGGMMAGNEHWCKPIDTWKAYFSHWVMTPGPEELLEISVFYDFTFVYGDQNLVDELHHYVHKELKTTDIFSHLMAIAWMPFAPEKNYHPENLTNLKTLLMPLTGLVRLYSISNGITATGTLDRIAGLLQAGIFDRHMAVSLIEAWQNLTGIRLQFQSGQIINAIPPDNQLDLRLLDEYRRFQIEKAVESIQRLVKKAELDFRTRSV